jgi:hypothetical protein
MIEFVNTEQLSKIKPVATDYLITLKDDEVTEIQYKFIKERLDNYKVFNEYNTEFETEYNAFSLMLVIGLIITISDLRTNNEKKEILLDTIEGFKQFYEKEIEPSKP